MRLAVMLTLLLVALVSAAIDLRTHFASDFYSRPHGTTGEMVFTTVGHVVYQHATQVPPAALVPGYRRSASIGDIALAGPGIHHVTHLLGHSFAKASIQGVRGFIWIFPLWHLTAAAGLLPAYRLYRYVITRPHRLPGVCTVCGYDLRASPGRCPECGVAPLAHFK